MVSNKRLTIDTSVIKNKSILTRLFGKEFSEYRIILTTLVIRAIAKVAKEGDIDRYIERSFLKNAITMGKEIGLVDLDDYEDKFSCIDEAIIQYCKETNVCLMTTDVYMYLLAKAKGVEDVLIYKENKKKEIQKVKQEVHSNSNEIVEIARIEEVLPEIYTDCLGKMRIVCGFDNVRYIEVCTPLKKRTNFGSLSLLPKDNIFVVYKTQNYFNLIHYRLNNFETVEVIQKFTFILENSIEDILSLSDEYKGVIERAKIFY